MLANVGEKEGRGAVKGKAGGGEGRERERERERVRRRAGGADRVLMEEEGPGGEAGQFVRREG